MLVVRFERLIISFDVEGPDIPTPPPTDNVEGVFSRFAMLIFDAGSLFGRVSH